MDSLKQWFQNRREKFTDWFNELDNENQESFIVMLILFGSIVMTVSINIMRFAVSFII